MRTAAISILLITLPTAAQTQPAVGLDALDDQRLIAELAERGLQTLLERAFEINQVSPDQREALRVLMNLKRLNDPGVTLAPGEREKLLAEVTGQIDRVAAAISDPATLVDQAAILLRHGVERDANTLEYWGENPQIQQRLRPVAEAVAQLLDKAHAVAAQNADHLANQLRSADDPLIDQWQKIDTLATNAKYTRHMADYYRALSLDRADPRRRAIADAAIEYLAQFDNSDSQVQPIVRLRLAKLHLAKGDYQNAREIFATVADNSKGQIQPEPEIPQQYEARYFSAVAELLRGNLDTAQTALNELVAWQKQNLPDDPSIQSGAQAGTSMLQYRIHNALADAAKDPQEKARHTEAGVQVLLQLVKQRPDLGAIIYDLLLARLSPEADLTQLDPLLLQAVIRQAEQERLSTGGGQPNLKVIARGLDAAQELLKRPNVDSELKQNAALLVPFFLESLNRHAEAAGAFISFIEKYPQDRQMATIALDHALALIGRMRRTDATSAATTSLYDRVLPIAINEPFGRKEFAYEYARRLQQLGRAGEAFEYFEQVPADNSRQLHAQFYGTVALKQRLDDPAETIDPDQRRSMLQQVQSRAERVKQGARAAMVSAKSEEERRGYQSMLARTLLLAADLARREGKDPGRALSLLSDFHNVARGLPDESGLIGEALFVRVQSHMDLGQNSEATQALVQLLQTQEGGQGATIVYNLLQKLNADLERARAADDEAKMREVARNRAALSGFLVEWAQNNPDEKIRQFNYRYAVFDAASKHLAAQLEPDPAQRKAGLEAALALFRKLEEPQNVELYRQTLDPRTDDPNYPDPQVMLGIGLIQFDLGQYQEAQQRLGRLLTDRKLGTATRVIEEDGQQRIVDNDQYWEATYKLMRSNAELAAAGQISEAAMAETKNHLKRLYIQWGDRVGGQKWAEPFEALRQELVPDFNLKTLTPTTNPS